MSFESRSDCGRAYRGVTAWGSQLGQSPAYDVIRHARR